MRLLHNCDFCDEQFHVNEARMKKVTIPVFIIACIFAFIEYPFKISNVLIHLLNETIVIYILWIVNRYIIFRFHKLYKEDRNKRIKLLIRYLISIVVSIGILALDIQILHSLYFQDVEKCTHATKLTHFNLYIIVVLFVYFVNASYERLFLFMELSNKAIEAEKYKKDSVEARFNNLKNKINPHFLFNTFNALSEAIEEDPPKASRLMQELSDVYRFVLDNEDLNWISVKKELEIARSYLSLLQMRFEENLIVTIDIGEDQYDYQIAPLTLQILLENAIKHNEISSKRKLHLDLYVENQLLIIKNNLQPKEIIHSRSSFGLNNLKERYKFLSDKEIHIMKTESEFIVEIPLIRVERNENTDI